MPSAIGPSVVALWRYPVKSMLGEQVEQVDLTRDGVPGDRGWAVCDATTGRALSAKGLPVLLEARAMLRPAGPVFALPDGRAFSPGDPRADEALSEWLGRPVRLSRPSPGERPVVEEEGGETFLGRAGPGFFDSSPIHIVTTATQRWLQAFADADFDPRRFRPNIVVEADGNEQIEQTWIGSTMTVGSARLHITKACKRCVMTSAAQFELPRDKRILGTVAREGGNITGVYARVEHDGVVAVGDDVLLG